MSILKVQEIQHTNATSALTISTGGNVTVPSGDLIVDTNTLVVDASANKVGIGTASPATAELDVSGKIRASSGILFGTDTADTNALDDYEEIDFTPTVSNGFTTVSHTVQKGRATKIGRVVIGHLQVAFSAASRNSGQVTISGLPYTSTNTGDYSTMGGVITYQASFSNTFNQVFIGNNGTVIQFHEVDGSSLTGSETSGASGVDIRIAFSYVTD